MTWPEPLLVSDRAATDHVQVRVWEHQGGVWRGPAAAHPAVEITWVEAGCAIYHVGARELQVTPGHAVVIPRDVEHVTDFASAGTAGSLRLSTDMLAEVADAVGPSGKGSRLSPGIAGNSERIICLGRMIQAEVAREERGHLLVTEALGEALAVELLRSDVASVARNASNDPRITAALDCIEAGYGEPLTVDDMARAAGMSRFHFSRRFRQVVGKSPYQYLLETRLGHAAALLRRGHHSVTAAALSVGFNDLGRFSRMFRGWAGQTAEEYRRAHARPAVGGGRSAAKIA